MDAILLACFLVYPCQLAGTSLYIHTINTRSQIVFNEKPNHCPKPLKRHAPAAPCQDIAKDIKPWLTLHLFASFQRTYRNIAMQTPNGDALARASVNLHLRPQAHLTKNIWMVSDASEVYWELFDSFRVVHWSGLDMSQRGDILSRLFWFDLDVLKQQAELLLTPFSYVGLEIALRWFHSDSRFLSIKAQLLEHTEISTTHFYSSCTQHSHRLSESPKRFPRYPQFPRRNRSWFWREKSWKTGNLN